MRRTHWDTVIALCTRRLLNVATGVSGALPIEATRVAALMPTGFRDRLLIFVTSAAFVPFATLSRFKFRSLTRIVEAAEGTDAETRQDG